MELQQYGRGTLPLRQTLRLIDPVKPLVRIGPTSRPGTVEDQRSAERIAGIEVPLRLAVRNDQRNRRQAAGEAPLNCSLGIDVGAVEPEHPRKEGAEDRSPGRRLRAHVDLDDLGRQVKIHVVYAGLEVAGIGVCVVVRRHVCLPLSTRLGAQRTILCNGEGRRIRPALKLAPLLI